MSDYISREAMKEALENADADVCESYPDGYCDWGFGRKNINDVIDGVPAADVEPVRHGNWNIRRSRRSALCLVCSVCGRNVDNDDLGILLEFGEYGVARHLYPYCHCGAKMCLEGENNDD